MYSYLGMIMCYCRLITNNNIMKDAKACEYLLITCQLDDTFRSVANCELYRV